MKILSPRLGHGMTFLLVFVCLFWAWPSLALDSPDPLYRPVAFSKKFDRPTSSTYIVQKGDSLGRIAKRFNTSSGDLVRLNGIKNPNHIHPGQKLAIPGIRGIELDPQMKTESVVVQPGDTLSVMASRFKTTVEELKRTNNMGRANTIYVGEVLQIPNPNILHNGKPIKRFRATAKVEPIENHDPSSYKGLKSDAPKKLAARLKTKTSVPVQSKGRTTPDSYSTSHRLAASEKIVLTDGIHSPLANGEETSEQANEFFTQGLASQ